MSALVTVRRHVLAIALLSVALLALGLASGASAYTQLERTTTHHERLDWTERASYSYVVPVERNSTLWPVGTTLPMGMPAYFRTITQNVTVAFSWRPSDAASVIRGPAQATMTLRVRAETPDGRPYWTIEHPLAVGTATDLDAGPLEATGTLDLDRLVDEVSRIARELPPGDGKMNWSIETVVTHGDHGADASYRFPFDVSDPRILLPSPPELTWARPHTTQQDVTTEARAGWTGVLSSLRSLALLAGGLGGLALVTAAAWSDPGRGRPARDAAFRREHAEHAEWVTVSGPVQERALPAAVVDVPSLAALVETAADARTRVVLDARRRVYYALLPNVAYRYARHARRPPPAAAHRPQAGAGKKAAR